MFTYKKYKDSATLISYDGNEKILHIPSIIDGLKVNKMTAMCIFGNEEVEEIHFPENISIENNAIVDCPNLRTIYISNVSRLGNFVEDCDNVEIVVNNTDTSKKLTRKKLENVIDLSIFETTTNSDGTLMISHIKNLKKKNGPKTIHIPNYINGIKVTKLTNNLFEYASLDEVILNDFIEEIPSECFLRAVIGNIKNISNIKKVGPYAFYYCLVKNEEGLNFENLEYVENNGFYCSSFKLKVGNNLKEIKRSAFSFSGIEEISLLKHIDVIPEYAFADCRNLKKVILPKTIRELSESCLSICSKLTEIKNIDKVQIFGKQCLDRSTSYKFNTKFNNGKVFKERALCKVKLPKKLVIGNCYLENGTFMNCDCNEVVFTDEYRLDYIPSSLFGYLPNLRKVTLSKGIKIINERAFEGVKIIHINLEYVEEIKTLAFSRTNLKEITLKNIKELYRSAFDSCKYLRKVNMEEATLEILPNSCFKNCQNLEEFKFPKGLKIIETSVFNNTGFKTLCIPEGVESFGISTFANNLKLRYLEIPSTINSLCYDCFSNLKKVEIKFNGPINLTNVEGLFKGLSCDTLDLSNCIINKIGFAAFQNFKAKKLILPKGIKEIGNGSFIHATINELVMDYDSIDAVRTSAFMFSHIKGLQVPKNARIFNDSCFYNANLNLKKVELNNPDVIGSSAFYSVGKIEEVVINTNPSKLETSNFVRCGIKKISSPNSKVLTRLKARKALKTAACTFEKIK